MKIVIITISSFLSVIGLMYINLKTYKKETNISSIVKQGIILGAVLGTLVSILATPITLINVLTGLFLGILWGEALCIVYLIIIGEWTFKKAASYYYEADDIPAKYFITGDKHRNFDGVKEFCRDMNTRKKDVLIILGDAGFNYFDDERDDKLKKKISKLNITLFCLHGNKENRPQNVGTYGIRSFCGGKVYCEPKYPNIYFAIDGEIYTFEGKKYMVVGGAHSVDKLRSLEQNDPFWEDEMPDDSIKEKVEKRLDGENYKIYGMMTHTCPEHYLPSEMFVSTRQNITIKRKPRKVKYKKFFKLDIDRSTEEWLGRIEKQLDYEVWYCGHYHIDKQIDKIHMMYRKIKPLHMHLFGKK